MCRTEIKRAIENHAATKKSVFLNKRHLYLPRKIYVADCILFVKIDVDLVVAFFRCLGSEKTVVKVHQEILLSLALQTRQPTVHYVSSMKIVVTKVYPFQKLGQRLVHFWPHGAINNPFFQRFGVLYFFHDRDSMLPH